MCYIFIIILKNMRRFPVNFLILFLFRLASVFLIRTSYVPDEYWQALEVAHKMTFNYGFLTWEWKHGLRTYIYPLMFSVLYKILQFLHLDFPYAVILFPRIFQALVTSVSDYYFLLWCERLGCNRDWVSLNIFTNWFWFYCGSRTIINTFETSITIITLYYYPWEILYNSTSKSKKLIKMKSSYLIMAVFNCLIRPTAAAIWGPLALLHMMAVDYKYKREFLLKVIIPVSVFMLSLSVIIDSLFYQRFVIVPFEFLKFNIIKGISSFYGVHSFFWYFTQGIPTVLGLHVLPFASGCLAIFFGKLFRLKFPEESFQYIYRIISAVVIFNIIIFSSIPHKEFRFILPLMPMMMLIAIKFTSQFHYISKFISTKPRFNSITVRTIWMSTLIIGFIIPVILFGIFHQRGTLTVMNYLSREAQQEPDKSSFLFLMPCHSTPLYSHLHVNVTARFLECEPPLTSYQYDEAEDFFSDPEDWLKKNWDKLKSPSHVICFNGIISVVESFVKDKGFDLEEVFSHTIFPEGRIGNNVIVFKKKT